MAIRKFQDLTDFPDCTALSEHGKCAWLLVPVCLGENCPFKRSYQENIKAIEHSFRRISSLDNVSQSCIAKKYYSGSTPWNVK